MEAKEKKPYGGFGELFDFSHSHSLKGKLKNIAFVFLIDLIWTICVSAVLIAVLSMDLKSIASLLLDSPFPPQWWGNASPELLLGIGGDATASAPSVLGKVFLLVFFVCVMAPLTEEVLFRVLPIQFAQIMAAVALALDKKKCSRFVLWICLGISGILFGWMHGSPLNILYQGMGGLLFAWLYLKNNNSYWSVVVAHFLWNFMLLIGLPILLLFNV
jgi:membrane protease YdiL (CAAX protease family)